MISTKYVPKTPAGRIAFGFALILGFIASLPVGVFVMFRAFVSAFLRVRAARRAAR